MNIYTDPRTGIKYADYKIGGKRRRISLKTKDNKIAILRAGKLADDFAGNNQNRVVLESFLNRYRDFLAATRKPDTAKHFELGLKKLLSVKKIVFLDEITPALLDEVAVSLKSKIKGQNAPGLNRAIRSVKTAMRQAEFWDLIPPQNWRKVSKFKESKGRIEFHTPDEIKQILGVLNEHWRLVVLLGCRAGLRRGEIANLKWEDVDFKNNQLYIAPNKTDKHRYIPIAEDLKKALEKAQKGLPKEVYVINVGDTGHRNEKDYLSTYYRKATVHLPFNCFLHKLRHTFASHLVQAGIDLYRVKNLMGHSSITMTEIYAHLAPQDLKSAIKSLPSIK